MVTNNAGTLLALGAAVFTNVFIDRNSIVENASQTSLSGAAAGANVSIAGILSNNVFSGAGTYVSTITGTDTNWLWTANVGVTNTPISGSGAWGAITGTLSDQTDLQAALDAKQATLVSGTNIKTINGSTVLGSGDLVVSGAAPAYTAFTKDLGAAKRSGTFDITGLSGLTADKVVSIVQTAAPIASKGDARDEAEMEHINVTGYVVNATTIRAYWHAFGVMVGTYAFAYLVSG